MKIRTGYLVLFCMMLFSVAPVQAQDVKDFKNTTPEQRAQVQTTWLKTKLALNDDQTAKVSAINLNSAKEMEPVLKSSSGKWTKLKQAKQIIEKKEAAYKQVFTPDQFTKYLAVKSELKDTMKEKMKERKQQ